MCQSFTISPGSSYHAASHCMPIIFFRVYFQCLKMDAIHSQIFHAKVDSSNHGKNGNYNITNNTQSFHFFSSRCFRWNRNFSPPFFSLLFLPTLIILLVGRMPAGVGLDESAILWKGVKWELCWRWKVKD